MVKWDHQVVWCGIRRNAALYRVRVVQRKLSRTEVADSSWKLCKVSKRTWFNIQRAGVDLDVQVLGGSGAELLQDTVDGLGDVVRHWFGELHLAVDDHAAFPEVKNLQFLEAREVCLQVRQQLGTEEENHFVVCFCHFKHFWLFRQSIPQRKEAIKYLTLNLILMTKCLVSFIKSSHLVYMRSHPHKEDILKKLQFSQNFRLRHYESVTRKTNCIKQSCCMDKNNSKGRAIMLMQFESNQIVSS